ncbi:MAG: 3-dehydroquinate synthase [Cyanobacteriota bacterium]
MPSSRVHSFRRIGSVTIQPTSAGETETTTLPGVPGQPLHPPLALEGPPPPPPLGDTPAALPKATSEALPGIVEELQTCLATPSPLFLGQAIEAELVQTLAAHEFDTLFLFSEPRVFAVHGQPLLDRLRHGQRCVLQLVGTGESCKRFASLEGVLEGLIAAGASKRSLLIAFGGGAVGNLVGLAAALLFRGVRYIEIPTTMTGQTDSVLSNKQAINGRYGKNLFGLYHAPLFIWVDTHYLLSEPLASCRSGIVEGIKNGFIADPPFLAYLESVLEPEHRYSANQRHGLVRRLILSKLPILRRDPSEKGYGIILEYGHTFGHGLEFLLGGRMQHGEAVAYGMRIAARLAHRLGLINAALVDRHDQLIVQRLGFAAPWPESVRANDLLNAMASDNKKTGRELRYVLLEGLGHCANPEGDWMMKVEDGLVLEVLEAFIAEIGVREATTPC